MRVALGVSYRGTAYQGWQSQPGGNTVQDRLEQALARFLDGPVRVMCAGRTDAGVHALNQVVHLDTEAAREPFSWVRGTNRFLPDDIAVQWCRVVDDDFHARNSALGRRYVYVMRESPVRPAVESGLVGWSFRPLDGEAMRRAAPRRSGSPPAVRQRWQARWLPPRPRQGGYEVAGGSESASPHPRLRPCNEGAHSQSTGSRHVHSLAPASRRTSRKVTGCAPGGPTAATG